jgi:atypical dual specificity phosphatase
MPLQQAPRTRRRQDTTIALQPIRARCFPADVGLVAAVTDDRSLAPRATTGTLALTLIVLSLPMFRGPRWLKSLFARTVRASKRIPRWNWTELKGTSILIGSVPRSQSNLQELFDHGVRAVVTLNQRWEPQVVDGVGAACRKVGLAHLHLPTPDYSSPTLRDIRQSVQFMSAHSKNGSVYVHCNAGRGRSAVCVLAFLIQAHGMSAQEAYMFTAAQRHITPLPTRMLGFRRPQWRALLAFERDVDVQRRESAHPAADGHDRS